MEKAREVQCPTDYATPKTSKLYPYAGQISNCDDHEHEHGFNYNPYSDLSTHVNLDTLQTVSTPNYEELGTLRQVSLQRNGQRPHKAFQSDGYT